MSMEKAYEPAKYEARIYQMWEESGAFKPAGDPKKPPFSIIMPPPNANGNLHTGHAMFTVEDILVRYHRMQGHPTLWLPGTDHAGIETQVVFERELAKQGKSRFDYSPTEFYDAALAYTKKNQHNIISQLKSLGFSADWSKQTFTLDEKIIDIVYDTFKRLLADGLIYRGNRIVNWCPTCHSAFADIEISHREQIDPLYYIRYGPFVVATVRPETKFGDTAIAVHPNDERYQSYIGKEVEIQDLLGPVKLKVIGDSFVNPEFGTGVVKVTPAHDPNDWEMGQRHHLEVKQAIGTDGRLTDIAGKYAGMKADDARQQVVQDLEAAGLIDHIEMDYHHSVAYHGRCGTIIEPLVTEQWWLKVKELKKPAIDAVRSGKVKIIPQRFEKVYLDWMENLKDWNISRQIWFGIRVPIYYRAGVDPSKPEYAAFSRENEAKEFYGAGNYEAETDTLDTWFSSSQWPYATLMANNEFNRFYPTSVMETGRDILFQWVTRMVVLGLYRTGDVPFRTVYLHGLVNDAHGKKMSKSRGNVIDPLDFTSRYGTDALRLALTIGITPGNDGALSEKKVEGYRNFCNKLWNVARFILEKAGDDYLPEHPKPTSLPDFWILDAFSRENAAITKAIEEYRFSEAGERIYNLIWNDLADWYLEASKIDTNVSVLAYVLETALKLLHPFAPFVTEVIWQNLPWQSQNLITANWPQPMKVNKKKSAEFSDIMALISQIRSISHDLGLRKPKIAYLRSELIAHNAQLIAKLAGTETPEVAQKGRGVRVPASRFDAWIDVDEDIAQSYVAILKRKRDGAGEYLRRLERQLDNPAYVTRAPADVVAETKARAAETEALKKQLDEQLGQY